MVRPAMQGKSSFVTKNIASIYPAFGGDILSSLVLMESAHAHLVKFRLLNGP